MNWKIPALAVVAITAGLAAFADSKPALSTSEIDHMVRVQWNADNVVPAPPVDDARFLRRAYLDIAGKIPTSEAVTSFLADRSPDKRAKAVDALLNSEDYANHWTTYWDNVLMGRNVKAQ